MRGQMIIWRIEVRWRWMSNDDIAKCNINEVRLMTIKVKKNHVITTTNL